MAKDPAFLFYPNDYIGGTMGMSFEEKGAYMELLVLQFNKGAFTIEQAKKILNGTFERVWPELQQKFTEAGGKYFNQRLEKEKSKRGEFIKGQSDRGKKSAQKRRNSNVGATHGCNPRTNQDPVGNNKEDENRNENKDGFGDEDLESAENLSPIDESLIIPKMFTVWKKAKPKYPDDKGKDFPALAELANFFCLQSQIPYNPRDGNCTELILKSWQPIVEHVAADAFFKKYSLCQVSNHIQSIIQNLEHGDTTGTNQKSNPANKQLIGEGGFGKL